MKIHTLSAPEVLLSLATTENGLTTEEAERRFSEFGPNEIKEVPRVSLTRRFLSHLTHFLAILLWVAAGLSLLSEYLHPGEGMLTLGLAIIAVILINAVFTFIQEYRVERTLEELRKLLPFMVKVIRDGIRKEIPASEVVPGDIILLSEGDKVPADCRLIEDSALKVNNAPLTGESEPVLRKSTPYTGAFIESPNIVFAGTTVLSGTGKGAVFATGLKTEFGKIAHLTRTVEPGLSPLQKEIIKVTRIVAFLSVLMGVVFFIIGHLAGRTFWENYLFAIGIIVANVPEGLLPTVTLSLAMGSRRMAKRNAIVKTLTSVETLGSVTTICTDKTGTLTKNTMEAKVMWLPEGIKEIDKAGNILLMRIALLCNNTVHSDGKYIGDPTETALYKIAQKVIGPVNAKRIKEIPFDPERKKMTTIDSIGGRTFAHTKGAPEAVLSISDRILLDGSEQPLSNEMRAKIHDACYSLMDKGLRVLAFAYKETAPDAPEEEIESRMVFAGLIGLEDPPRPEVPEAIKKCKKAGIKVVMITGDATRTAVAIGREIGLFEGNPIVIEGQEFVQMKDHELREKLASKEVIFTRMTPKNKLRVVTLLKEEGERVAVTGDGVNDAPALRKADIGISMGLSGTDVAKEASDIVLLDDNFATIVNAVEEGRAVYENIRKFISYIFASNIPEIVPYIGYSVFRIPLALTILQILAVDLGTDLLPALALGAERPTERLMSEPPRSPNERLLSFKILLRSYLFLGPIEAVAGMFGFFYVLTAGGWTWGESISSSNPLYMQATTACLTAIVVTQVANVFACRSYRESVFSIGFFSNKLIFLGILVEIILQLFIVYHPWGNSIFATRPISAGVWLALVPFAIILFFAEEARKLLAETLRKAQSR